ncbi:GntR family transcriptional regulator [Rhizobium sp. TH135]|uniref:GntR family transcriptional regulator n=1 Tax=Rhizobium sp. TH135 TaxID=2067451 RepID=UPI000C7A866C|nr:GntR family transcriptional regulator [Rhizobium sp. TH135]PLK70282.1 GntR family transcriptional regulator [Rhizobium sp. TH135]
MSVSKSSPDGRLEGSQEGRKGGGRLARPALLVDEVMRSIRDMIVDGRVRPGERLSENALAAELGVSTTPVREAIALLRRQGLVTVQPQSGTYVFELQPGELNRLCELRFALEPSAVQLALQNPESSLSETLDRIVAHMKKAQAEGRTRDYLALDTSFHDAIIGASDNEYFNSAYALIGAKMAALRYRLGADPHHMEKSMREHIEIADAIRARDLSRAVSILVRHIARKEGSYWEHLDTENLGRLERELRKL